MNKILFVASIPGHITAFHLPYLKMLKDMGCEVHVAYNGSEDVPYADKIWNIPIDRSPPSFANIRAYRMLKDLVEKERFSIVHCHTPVASVLSRLSCRKIRKCGTKVLYTAHGFHFYTGAPFLNWLVYFPMEFLLSFITDAIICINSEDYSRASKWMSRNRKAFLISGIGVDSSRFQAPSRDQRISARNLVGVQDDELVMVYSAAFRPDKDHRFIVYSVSSNREIFSNIKVIFAGDGSEKNRIQDLVNRNGLADRFVFLGHVKNVYEVYSACDAGVSVSRREGLGINLVEEMMMGIPVIATNNRGHREIISHGENGLLFPINDVNAFVNCVDTFKINDELRRKISETASVSAKRFDLIVPLSQMRQIYSQYLEWTV